MATSNVSFDAVKDTTKNVQRKRKVANRRWPKEVDGLEQCFLWWERKCAYCVGKGLLGAGIEHEMRSCPNGGRQQRFKGIGEAIYLEGFFVRAGCEQCAVPKHRCGAWKRSDSQQWVREKDERCKWGSVVYDTIIALFHSGVERFYLDIYEAILDEGELDYIGLDHESVAAWLTRPKRQNDNAGSAEIIEVFKRWTEMVQND
ncbi:MAG: hypothetical protein Q9196_005420, partial [Gyalolechia fulgens]